ncbi:MAG: bifunctional phosphopantothenoylcysteine decarboxylase/phosphopantothenate--cysteine ligase CoaBC [Abditibacteriales bacterium]|nr:bifunctional phosphopantothenoylcysteine decarboxylase/phosphopantothenate--cysteine ligase CoaBC [Abditibacteriales bacterium]MDW8367105.1 bifunctional phosphopantothenoylcysteine decarboxylase/phosphopantothenate--cysteine ligase CoaBC [Abditibacteriales bacterium]
MSFQDRTILLGVSGGIAAFKAVEIASALRQQGASVHVVMTRHATLFVTPLTFESITHHPVAVEFSRAWETELIPLAQHADLFLIAPTTANVMAKLAAGIADDVLTALALATRAPLLLAPAMHTNMWTHAATQANVATLAQRGATFVGPEHGWLASGDIGLGRLASLEAILRAAAATLTRQADWQGVRVLITAGATREAIDPVRFISNRSSGKMGYALAEAARARGATVTLISGPTHLPPPPHVNVTYVQTAEEMLSAVLAHFDESDVFISAAAIADFKPSRPLVQKLKKTARKSLTLELEPTPDVLRTVAARRTHQLLVGFAAESENLLAHAQEKLRQKNLDLIVANDVTLPDAGFEVDTNIVTLLTRDGKVETLPKMSKREVAERILDVAKGLRAG